MQRNVIEIRVEFGDCDPGRLIYYPKYFEFFDRATWRLFESVGLSRSVLWGTYRSAGLPLVDAGARFLNPVRWDDRLSIESRVTRWGRKSFDLRHEVAKDGTLCVEGREIRVWTQRDPDDPERLLGIMVPDEVIARFRMRRDG